VLFDFPTDLLLCHMSHVTCHMSHMSQKSIAPFFVLFCVRRFFCARPAETNKHKAKTHQRSASRQQPTCSVALWLTTSADCQAKQLLSHSSTFSTYELVRARTLKPLSCSPLHLYRLRLPRLARWQEAVRQTYELVRAVPPAPSSQLPAPCLPYEPRNKASNNLSTFNTLMC
jgi:hypothetical protein